MPEMRHSTALTRDTILARTGGHSDPMLDHDFTVTSLTIDSRKCTAGSLFVAMTGEHADGHDFVAAAAANGATAALVTRAVADPIIQDNRCVQIIVENCQQALDDLAMMGRISHQQAGGRLVGITGSVGKTGSKEMLAHILARMGGCHASQASFNNHVGVPLTLAALPEAIPFAAQEMGMNAAGEIAHLTLLAAPDVAVITRIADSHAGFFASLEDIAVAKAEIFDGLTGLRTVVLNRDDQFFNELARRAKRAGAERIISFGTHDDADFRLVDCTADNTGLQIEAICLDTRIEFHLGMTAPHWAINALGMLAATAALGLDVNAAASTLADFTDLPGRGARHSGHIGADHITLVDDSYNAGPASMAAALDALQQTPAQILVLSDMLELGAGTEDAHEALIPKIASLNPRVIITLGASMHRMTQNLVKADPDNTHSISCHAADDPGHALSLVLAEIADGDLIFIKGSHGSGAHLVAAGLIEKLTSSPDVTMARTANSAKGESHAA
jgi:UDP-N-acetylmuramoyl-tripeptide--D-alanyl-D-alanine ligase